MDVCEIHAQSCAHVAPASYMNKPESSAQTKINFLDDALAPEARILDPSAFAPPHQASIS